jgi:amino acid transporter
VPHETQELPRTLGTASATAVVIGTVIGSGIFAVPASVAAETGGSVGAILLLWLAGGAIALCGALSLAEVACTHPGTGGIYVILRETYGPPVAFLFGWGMLLVNPASYAAVALILARSVAALLPAAAPLERWVAAASLAILMIANYRSLGFGAAIQNVATTAKVVVLVGLAALALGLVSGEAGALSQRTPLGPASWAGLGIALIAVLFAYDGWQWLPQLAGEMKAPARTLPRALGGGVAIVFLVYMVTNLANLHVLSVREIAGSSLVTADVATRALGRIGASVVAALIVVATASSNNGGFMTDPRVFFAMARDGLFFRSVAAVHPRFRTPHVAVVWIGLTAMVYLLFRNFEELLATLVLGMWPLLALAVAAVIVLRHRRPELPRPFRVPGYPVVPIVFLLAAGVMFVTAIATNPVLALTNVAVLGAGIPVYWLWRGGTERRP